MLKYFLSILIILPILSFTQDKIKTADSLQKNGNYISANQVYFEIIKEYPEYDALDRVYERIGFNYSFLDQNDSAIHYLTKSIDLNSKNAASYYYRGHVFLDYKMYKPALNDFKKCYQIKPEIHSAFNIGKCYYKIEQYDSALYYTNETLKFDQKDEPALLQKIDCHVYLDQKKKAEETCKKLIALDRKNATNLQVYALLKGNILKDYKGAIDLLNQCIDITPSNEELFWYKAIYFSKMEMHYEAVETWDQFMELEDENPKAYQYRADAWVNVGILNFACRDYKLAIENNHPESESIAKWVSKYCD